MFRLPRPQKNYTEVPNAVFDVLIPSIPKVSPLKCYLVLVRKTWGWQKVGDWLSLSQLTDLTRLSRPSVISGMKWLEDNGLVWSVKAGKLGSEKVMYFLCSEETEQLERSIKEGVIKPDTLFKKMMDERN